MITTEDWENLFAFNDDKDAVLSFYQKLERHINNNLDLGVFTENGLDFEKVYSEILSQSKSKAELFPLPIGVKDIISVSGYETRCGSRLPPGCFEGPEASIITKLKSLGAVILGKTVTTEFAGREPGPTKNPCNPKHTPGGSSSGSAAGVAAGFFPIALGTQTSGSVIRPASFCGVYGFKPSFGKLPIDGVFPLSPSLDHVGIIAASFDFIVKFSSAYWSVDLSANVKHRKLKFVIPTGPYLDKADKQAQDALYQFTSSLKELGHAVAEHECLTDIDAINERHYSIVREEAVKVHEKLFNEYSELYSEQLKDALLQGSPMSAEQVEYLKGKRIELRTDLQKILEDSEADYFLCPSTVSTAPEGLELTGSAIMNLIWTHAGMPVVTIPIREAGRLPLGVQIVGAFDKDLKMLSELSQFA